MVSSWPTTRRQFGTWYEAEGPEGPSWLRALRGSGGRLGGSVLAFGLLLGEPGSQVDEFGDQVLQKGHAAARPGWTQ